MNFARKRSKRRVGQASSFRRENPTLVVLFVERDRRARIYRELATGKAGISWLVRRSCSLAVVR